MLLSIKFGQTEMILSGWHWQKIRFNSTHTSAYKKNYFNKLWHGSFGMSPLFFFHFFFVSALKSPFLFWFLFAMATPQFIVIHSHQNVLRAWSSLIFLLLWADAISFCGPHISTEFFGWPLLKCDLHTYPFHRNHFKCTCEHCFGTCSIVNNHL